MGIPMALRLVLEPASGSEFEPPKAWLEAARHGLASAADLAALAARVMRIEADTNIRVIVDPDTNVLRISAVGGVASYRTVSADAALDLDDNGRVVEVDSAVPVTLALPTGLPRGWVCLVRQVGAGTVTVRRASGVRIAPDDGDLATAAPWQEIALESRGDDQVIGRVV
jgi:hypothetical protein